MIDVEDDMGFLTCPTCGYVAYEDDWNYYQEEDVYECPHCGIEVRKEE